jgi:hypothetical protein
MWFRRRRPVVLNVFAARRVAALYLGRLDPRPSFLGVFGVAVAPDFVLVLLIVAVCLA